MWESAGVCRSPPESAGLSGLCRTLPDYVGVLQESAGLCKSPGGVWQSLQESGTVWHSLQESGRVCRSLQESAGPHPAKSIKMNQICTTLMNNASNLHNTNNGA
jgi:hypothetical protein